MQPDVVVHAGQLHAVKGHTGLVDVSLCQRSQLPECGDPLVIVSGQILFDLADQARPQGIFPLADLVGVQLVSVLVCGRKLSQLHRLRELFSQTVQPLGRKAHVRDGRPAVQQMMHSLRVLQLYPEFCHHVMGHQPRFSVLCFQADVHQIMCKVVQLLFMLRSGHICKNGFAFCCDPFLPSLAVVQHPPQLLHRAAVVVAAQPLKVPFDVHGIQPVCAGQFP